MRISLLVAAALATLCVIPSAEADQAYPSGYGGGSIFSAPPAKFSGIEFGLEAGGGVGSISSYTSSGFAGGGQLGYNIQMGGFVAGVEGDVLVSNLAGTVPGSATLTTGWLDSLRGRAGYAFGPVLAFGEFGGAYSSSTYSNGLNTLNTSLGGYVFGVGGEYAVAPNISLRGEVRRYLLSETTYILPSSTLTGSTGQTMVLFGVSGHF